MNDFDQELAKLQPAPSNQSQPSSNLVNMSQAPSLSNTSPLVPDFSQPKEQALPEVAKEEKVPE